MLSRATLLSLRAASSSSSAIRVNDDSKTASHWTPGRRTNPGRLAADDAPVAACASAAWMKIVRLREEGNHPQVASGCGTPRLGDECRRADEERIEGRRMLVERAVKALQPYRVTSTRNIEARRSRARAVLVTPCATIQPPPYPLGDATETSIVTLVPGRGCHSDWITASHEPISPVTPAYHRAPPRAVSHRKAHDVLPRAV